MEAFQAQIAAVFRSRWEPGPEPETAPAPSVLTLVDDRVPMVVGG
jgi:hypothetical protein